jgi:NADPH:quinone reductase-like Zn-dependent oxidoreductase
MKAIVYTKFGPPEVLQLQEVKKPALNEDQVRTKVYAASINAGDIYGLVGYKRQRSTLGGITNESQEVFLWLNGL